MKLCAKLPTRLKPPCSRPGGACKSRSHPRVNGRSCEALHEATLLGWTRPPVAVLAIFQVTALDSRICFSPDSICSIICSWAIKADMIGFTTYPGLIYKNPDDIPDDYYSVIKQRINKPIVFTEIGWFREGPVGWESSDDEQKLFVEIPPTRISLDVRLNIWSFLYDPDTDSLFRTMGLLEDSEETSPALKLGKMEIIGNHFNNRTFLSDFLSSLK